VREPQFTLPATTPWPPSDTFTCYNPFRAAAALAMQIQGETIPTDKPGDLSMTIRQPSGSFSASCPWNGPVVLAARAIAYPNRLWQHCRVPGLGDEPQDVRPPGRRALYEAGLPAGVLNFVTNAPASSL